MSECDSDPEGPFCKVRWLWTSSTSLGSPPLFSVLTGLRIAQLQEKGLFECLSQVGMISSSLSHPFWSAGRVPHPKLLYISESNSMWAWSIFMSNDLRPLWQLPELLSLVRRSFWLSSIQFSNSMEGEIAVPASGFEQTTIQKSCHWAKLSDGICYVWAWGVFMHDRGLQ